MTNDRPGTKRDRPPTGSRRRFLRGAGLLTVGGAIPGCVDVPDGAPGSGGATDPGGATDGEPPDEQVQAYELAIHGRVNEARRMHDLDPLAFDEDVAAVARAHSADMAERGYFSHESPEGEGPDDRLDEFFPWSCRGIGENIAKVGLGPDDAPETVAERVVSGWMDSPGHRENVLREAFDEQGIGVAITDGDYVLATQNFCSTTGLGG